MGFNPAFKGLKQVANTDTEFKGLISCKLHATVQWVKVISINPQTATRGQIWPQPSFFFFDNIFGVYYSDTNLRDFVTAGVL